MTDDITFSFLNASAAALHAVREYLDGKRHEARAFLTCARRLEPKAAHFVWTTALGKVRRKDRIEAAMRKQMVADNAERLGLVPSSLSLHGECNVEPRYLWDSQTARFVENPDYAKDF